MAAYDKEYEQYEDWKNKQQSSWTRFIKNLEPRHYIILVLLIGVLIILVKDRTATDRNTLLVIGGMIIAIVIFLSIRSSEGKLITEAQAKIIVEETMNAKIPREYPTGTEVQLTGFCALRYWGRDNPYKWEIGVNLKLPYGNIKELMIAVHPYTGNIMKIMETPAGWNATEAPDLKPVYPFEYYREPPEAYGAEGE